MKGSVSSPKAIEVFETLKERIIRWDYAPGHRFTEEGLCTEFAELLSRGISRSPIREALRMLVENGLVEKEPHRGYSVKQPDMKTIWELYDVRLALETFVVRQLAQNGMPEERWQQLYETWNNMPSTCSGPASSDYPTWDEQFHEALAQATGNQTLVQTLRGIDERLHIIRIHDITSPERLQRTRDQHLKILACIQARDVASAQEALLKNVMDGRAHAEQAVKEAVARAYLTKQQLRRRPLTPGPSPADEAADS